MTTIIMVIGRQKHEDPWGFWLASLDYLINSKLVRDWVSTEVDSNLDHGTYCCHLTAT